MPLELDWLRAEAARQGLDLTEEDLLFIRDQVERVKAALAAQRPAHTEGLEPPYPFGAPRARRPRVRRPPARPARALRPRTQRPHATRGQ